MNEIITCLPRTEGLNEYRQSFVLNEGGFSLRALGRLREAAQPMEAALDLLIKKKNWKQAAIAASNLSELYLTLGEVRRAAVFRTSNQWDRARQDLEEAHEIAQRGSMNLFLADYHLEAARVCLAQGKKQQTKTFLQTAKNKINEMGYHRRNPEVEEMEVMME